MSYEGFCYVKIHYFIDLYEVIYFSSNQTKSVSEVWELLRGTSRLIKFNLVVIDFEN